MTGRELTDLLSQSYRRWHLTGTSENGIIAALDLEGRLFSVVNGNVVSRVVPSAIKNRSNRHTYQNPGGDTLWPAPEGTVFGYEYTTGTWRVPPAITGAVWEVLSHSENRSVIRTEIDLVNNSHLGIPCEFERYIEIEVRNNCLIQRVTEIIRYIGTKTLSRDEFSLAPWSLCQFDSGKKGKVIMSPPSPEDIWDLYESSESQRRLGDDGLLYTIQTETAKRIQLGLGMNVPWVEYILEDQFRVRRYAGELPEGHSYIDIADLPPDQLPSGKGVKLSVYCDPFGFMEIEACGGCPSRLLPGTELSARITTEYEILLTS
jgi:hypothetical protein